MIYCTRRYGVEMDLKMLIYISKLRFLDQFRLVSPSFVTTMNRL